MATTGPLGENKFISKAPSRLKIADIKVSAKQQLARVKDIEDQTRLVCTGSSLVGRPIRLDHRHCSSELGYAESTARIWSGCY